MRGSAIASRPVLSFPAYRQVKVGEMKHVDDEVNPRDLVLPIPDLQQLGEGTKALTLLQAEMPNTLTARAVFTIFHGVIHETGYTGRGAAKRVYDDGWRQLRLIGRGLHQPRRYRSCSFRKCLDSEPT